MSTPKRTAKNKRRINQIIIHCSATPNGRWTTVDDINRWHRDRGFQRQSVFLALQQKQLEHIGYHFVIYTNGAVAIGRHLDEVGAHARGLNRTSIAICMVGLDQYSRRQWESLRYLCNWLPTVYPDAKLVGHNSLNKNKTCPGFDVQAWVANEFAPLTGHVFKKK